MKLLSVSLLVASVALVGCGGGGGPSDELQSACVIDQLGLERTVSVGESCDNFGYSDCVGFGSECVDYCAFAICQPGECISADDCDWLGALPFGRGWACEPYVVSSKDYGSYCHAVDVCPEGTVNCPCLPDGTCGPDPFGDGNLLCAAGSCESACPSACIVGSVCCGGSLCSGDCIGTPCC